MHFGVAPLLFGSGIKGKVLDSFAAAVPCVMTSTRMLSMRFGYRLPARFARLFALIFSAAESFRGVVLVRSRALGFFPCPRARKTRLWGSLAVAALGLPLLLTSNLPAVLTGMVLVGVGTFFAQATATGFVGRAATSDRGSASGIYLACYFVGGLVGSALLGQLFDHVGWHATVAGIASSLILAAVLAIRLRT
jgi:dipeptide/tripeptide permease